MGCRDIVARHGEDGHQGDAARLSPDEPRALQMEARSEYM